MREGVRGVQDTLNLNLLEMEIGALAIRGHFSSSRFFYSVRPDNFHCALSLKQQLLNLLYYMHHK